MGENRKVRLVLWLCSLLGLLLLWPTRVLAQNGCDPAVAYASASFGGGTLLHSFDDGALRSNPSADGGVWYASSTMIGRVWSNATAHPSTQHFWQALGFTLAVDPTVVKLQGTPPDQLSALLVGTNGRVYRYDLPAGGAALQLIWTYDTRRGAPSATAEVKACVPVATINDPEDIDPNQPAGPSPEPTAPSEPAP